MDAFWNWWNSLTVTIREGIIIGVVGGVAATAIVGVCKLLGYSLFAGARGALKAGARRLLRNELRAETHPSLPPSVSQVEAAPPAPPLPPSDGVSAPPKPLPSPIPRPPVVGFVARRGEDGRDIIARLRAELAPEKGQLVALCGAGGVGKTTLAAESARSLSEAFAHRATWVSADGRPDFSLSTLLDEIAGQLGHTELRPLPLEQKAEQVRALVAEAPTLVVLDNFETIKPNEQKNCAEWLSLASCCAIVTSRIDVAHARPIHIPAMSLTEARKFLKEIIKQARNPLAFKNLDQDSIINAADRNPLVLQWVIKQIDRAKQPRDVLNELAQGKGDAAQRVFDRSFNLLSDDARATLLALSLFAPSASRPALAEVAGFGTDTERHNDAVGQLSELWLVGTTEGNERLTVEGLTRELSKAYLSINEHAGAFRKRFITYFRIYAKAHTEPSPENFDALETEKDNLMAAMDTAFDSEDWVNVVNLMSGINYDGASGFLTIRGYWDEALAKSAQALEATRHLRSDKDIAVSAHHLGLAYQARGELAAARQLYDESLEINKRLGDQSGIANALGQLGNLAYSRGDLQEARSRYDECLMISRDLNDQSSVAKVLHQLAILAQGQGDLAEARRLYDESMEIEKRLGDQSGIASTLHQLGILAQDQGEHDEARRLYGESLKIKKRLGDQSGIAITLHELGRLAQVQGELDEARRLYGESLEIDRRLGDQSGIALTLGQLGRLAEEEDDIAGAARLYREALSVFERLKSPYAEVARRDLARVEGKLREGG